MYIEHGDGIDLHCFQLGERTASLVDQNAISAGGLFFAADDEEASRIAPLLNCIAAHYLACLLEGRLALKRAEIDHV